VAELSMSRETLATPRQQCINEYRLQQLCTLSVIEEACTCRLYQQ